MLVKQHLAGKSLRPTTESILAIVRDLCYIQWDPVDAVAPSHIISFWSRLGNFRRSDLEKLLWSEKKLFLHWTPMASIVLTEDYPIYNSMMRRYPESLSDSWGSQKRRARKFLAENKELRRKILSELKKKGPLRQNQFQDYVRTRSPDGWIPGSKVLLMLYNLLMTGYIMIVGHQGNQNIYGLSEEFLPATVDRRELTEEEFEREAAQRALRALGTATPREIHLYFPRGCYLNLEKTLNSLERESKISRIDVEGLGRKGDRYIHELDIPLLESLDSDGWEPRMTLLAPFDNLICLRGRTNRLFSFDYAHENFLPQSKRKFGTFVHPILWGDALIGRVDMLRDKKNEKLNVISVHAEPHAPGGKEVSAMIDETIRQLGEFLGANDVAYPA
jgi:uncharacterized protein YcaQ